MDKRTMLQERLKAQYREALKEARSPLTFGRRKTRADDEVYRLRFELKKAGLLEEEIAELEG